MLNDGYSLRILFVCHGNICRSPMAEFILKDMLEKSGRSDIFVASCATSTEEIYHGMGNPIYPPAQRELSRRGIPFDKNKRAVQLKKEDYMNYDLFIAMDGNNVRNIMRIFGSDPEHKVHKLLENENNADVSDPWYTGDFVTCFNDIQRGCEALLERI